MESRCGYIAGEALEYRLVGAGILIAYVLEF
jgi:hypothetical protein